MRKVLMLTRTDHANTGWRFKKCLEHLGFHVTYYKAVPHQFKYPQQGEIHPDLASKERESVHPTVIRCPELKEIANEADIIHYIASTFIDTGVDLSKKKVVVNHAGHNYRFHPEEANRLFNEFVDYTIIQYPSLLGLGAKNEELIYYPVDTKNILWSYKYYHTTVGHWPPSPARKGTRNILEVVREFKDKINYVGIKDDVKGIGIADWQSQLDRIRKCDVYIERCQIDDGHAEWANTALEAAASGTIVITNTLSKELYWKEYGAEVPFFIANNPAVLYETLEELRKMYIPQIIRHKARHRKWVCQYHSIEATALRLWERVYKNLL